MKPKSKDELLKIALISDLHVDWDYTPGYSTECGKFTCCRHESGLAQSKDKAAGKWGDYQCDLPVSTLSNLLETVANEIKPDAVFWGGDSIPHNIESLTVEDNVNVMINTTKLI